MDSRVVRIILNSVHYLVGRRTPQKVELSSGGWAPCSTGFPHYMSILGTHLYQSTRWLCCERLCSASVIFSENSFSTFARFMMGDLQVHPPIPCWVFSSFWPKPSMTPVTHPPHSPNLAQSDFFCLPRWKKKSLKGNLLASVEEKQKYAEALKSIKIKNFKKVLLWTVGKVSR